MSIRGSARSKLRPSGNSKRTKQIQRRCTNSGTIPARLSSYDTSAPSSEIVRSSRHESIRIHSNLLPGEVFVMRPRSLPPVPRSTVKTSSVPTEHQGIRNRSNDSSTEIFTEHPLVKIFGPKTADWIAAKFRWSPPPPSQVLLAKTDESGRNYSESSSKREGRTVSAGSRKSRSGEALSPRMECLK